MPMRIAVIETSPHKNGASHTITAAFIKGAEEAGHTVLLYHAADMGIRHCLGCASGWSDQPCVQKDDMGILKDAIFSSDMLVFSTPVYFYGMTGTLKTIIDRCHCFSKALTAKHMKFMFIATAWRTDREVMRYLENYFNGLSRYLEFRDVQMILAKGCGDRASASGSSYERKAYEMGRKI